MGSEERTNDGSTPNVLSSDRRHVDRLRLPNLLSRYPARRVWTAFVLVNSFVTTGVLASVAMISGTPFIFPSLGPTALLLFRDPMSPAASPRSTLYGHAVGIISGYAALWLTGLTDDPASMVDGVHAQRVLCAAIALASTGAFMVLLRVWHPPAGATTLIIALGIITRPYHLLMVEAAVLTLVLQALVINRIAGLEYPAWSPVVGAPEPQSMTAED